ncbi:substrate-binding domain-containing protein [Geobacter sp. SVR]|uniref:substrate-binding domain-containing protein n=1 Tax=Geobacter sp. SVR TaxID=2495594 RepID=UPI00143F01F0|nr:substrate-binding domain-containing protein [Geobacter sp. SVR]BCS53512.1 phosphate ABC transporter substrate-binding protein [Geobacter sp. SVR]GCF84291.1 phosphate ABC transporter substrate-binding protein [Geobacter sp. SVR]
MRITRRITGICGGALLMLVLAVNSRAAEVRLSGAASVVSDLITPNKAVVEKTTGHTLTVTTSTAGKGLIDLVEGRSDASLASASLEATIQAAKSAGLKDAPANLKLHVVGTSEVVFIVHPSNRVTRLSWEQIRDIHTGKITNWKELGGKDLPITVYTDAKASATRGLIKQMVMGGQEYASHGKAVDFVKKVNDDVAQDEAGIGGLGIGFVDRNKVTIVESKKVERPFAFVTLGEPSALLRTVIDAYAQIGNRK